MSARNRKTPSRRPADDRLLTFAETCEFTRIDEAGMRWRRNQGTAPPFWRLGRRLVIWRSELLEWLDAERERSCA